MLMSSRLSRGGWCIWSRVPTLWFTFLTSTSMVHLSIFETRVATRRVSTTTTTLVCMQPALMQP